MRSLWLAFADSNKRFCRARLQPRLYPASQMSVLEMWIQRRLKRERKERLLEFGSGKTFVFSRLFGHEFSERAATDIEEVPSSSIPPDVRFVKCSDQELPFSAEQFDVVLVRSVIEHLPQPAVTFTELSRVLRTGGSVFMNLPNRWDYVSVIAMLSGRAKSRILKNVVRIRWDDFPVFYRCNTRRALERAIGSSPFEIEAFLPLPAGPAYLSFFVPFYVLGAIYQFTISLFGLDFLQPSFFVVLRKRTVQERASKSHTGRG